MLKDWVLGIPYLHVTGYALVFLAAFLETLPAAGIFIPGQTIVLIAGFLSQQGLLDPTTVLLFAIVGAIAGDSVGYYLGSRYKHLFKEQSGVIKEITQLLKDHPIKTLILGRFNSLTRAFAPFAAGANNISRRAFIIANIIGGVLWGCTWVLVGHIVGASYQLVSHWMNVVMLLIILLLSGSFYLYRFLRKRSLLTRRLILLLAICTISLVAFLAIVATLQSGGFFVQLDLLVNRFVPSLWSPLLTVVMLFFTSFIEPFIFAIFTLSTILLIRYHRSNWHAAAFATIIFGAAIIDSAFKNIAMRARPLDSLIIVNSYSFPSGHALLSTVFFGSLIILYPSNAPWRKTFVTSCVAAAFFVTISRVYLGVHWLSDSIAGVLLGLAWLSMSWLVFEGSARVTTLFKHGSRNKKTKKSLPLSKN